MKPKWVKIDEQTFKNPTNNWAKEKSTKKNRWQIHFWVPFRAILYFLGVLIAQIYFVLPCAAPAEKGKQLMQSHAHSKTLCVHVSQFWSKIENDLFPNIYYHWQCWDTNLRRRSKISSTELTKWTILIKLTTFDRVDGENRRNRQNRQDWPKIDVQRQ